MKPIFAKVPETQMEEIFAVRDVQLPYFSTEFHFHKECQLSYLLESEGKRIIGDSVESFTGGELILLGANLPHVWHNDHQYFNKDAAKRAHSLGLFFNEEKLLGCLEHLCSVKKLGQVLKTASRGIQFLGKTKELICGYLFEMKEAGNLQKLILLIKILDTICQTDEYRILASAGYTNKYPNDNNRIDQVFRYIFNHFASKANVTEAARIAHMSKPAFCRYFKHRTQKTFTEFVNEVRIGQVCKLMAEQEGSISQLAYAAGFNSIAHFNGLFKALRGVSPREYQNLIR